MQTYGMDRSEHGRRLKSAMAQHEDIDRQAVADYVGRSARTVTNWTSGKILPSTEERRKLRELLGDYDAEGDAVEVAVRSSGLVPFRQSRVIACYQEQLHEQEREGSVAG